MSKPLLSIAHSDDPLTIPIPGDIIDPASDDVIFPFRILSAHGIPHADAARDIPRGDVESAGGKAGDTGLGGVLGVLFANCRVIDVADEDGFVGSVGYALTFGVGGEDGGLAAGCGG